MRLYDGDTFEHGGYSFRVMFPADEDHGAPWDNEDGHGVISDWTTRDKAAGERVLCTDRNSKRFYDVPASMKLARKDGWGCSHSTRVDNVFSSGHKTKGEAAACAVDEDYERMRRWCADQWSYIGVVVTLLDYDGEETDTRKSLWGIESDSDDYHVTVAKELADEIISRLGVDTPDVVLSEN